MQPRYTNPMHVEDVRGISQWFARGSLVRWHPPDPAVERHAASTCMLHSASLPGSS